MQARTAFLFFLRVSATFFRIAALRSVDDEENIKDENGSGCSQAQLHDAQFIRFYIMAEEWAHSWRSMPGW